MCPLPLKHTHRTNHTFMIFVMRRFITRTLQISKIVSREKTYLQAETTLDKNDVFSEFDLFVTVYWYTTLDRDILDYRKRKSNFQTTE